MWTETTDPQKYVYEDIAIATYLLLIWKEERIRRKTQQLQSFADLGCGNGLLVYILTAEGHTGFGMDVRKRNIWQRYPIPVDLREEPIVPSARALLPDIDWIIGNHSDELSIWIPVLTARSSYNCRFFLLPCCAYNFDGQKYQRRSSNRSQYEDFIFYVKEVSEVCGFDTKIDRLKIPSTKRIAIVGDARVYEDTELSNEKYMRLIDALISDKTQTNNDAGSDAWSSSFVPRPAVETVRNCTKICKNVAEEIVKTAFDKILTKKRFSTEYENWNIGGSVLLTDIAKDLNQNQLHTLKSECGGLQTLLKNHSSIFSVVRGTVEIRTPIKYSDKLKEIQAKNRNMKFNYKLKPCWFQSNHPDGCPLSDADCTFSHEQKESNK